LYFRETKIAPSDIASRSAQSTGDSYCFQCCGVLSDLGTNYALKISRGSGVRAEQYRSHFSRAARDCIAQTGASSQRAMFALGALHSGGHDFPLDRAIAQRWFRALAERGHGQAQLMLGRYLIEGVAGKQRFS
jgi:TPR repeat protein